MIAGCPERRAASPASFRCLSSAQSTFQQWVSWENLKESLVFTRFEHQMCVFHDIFLPSPSYEHALPTRCLVVRILDWAWLRKSMMRCQSSPANSFGMSWQYEIQSANGVLYEHLSKPTVDAQQQKLFNFLATYHIPHYSSIYHVSSPYFSSHNTLLLCSMYIAHEIKGTSTSPQWWLTKKTYRMGPPK